MARNRRTGDGKRKRMGRKKRGGGEKRLTAMTQIYKTKHKKVTHGSLLLGYVYFESRVRDLNIYTIV